MSKPLGRYQQIIQKLFFDRYQGGKVAISFSRTDIEPTAHELGIKLPKNLGDVIYSVRYRTPMPQSILDTQPEGLEWIIEGAGKSQYEFKLVKVNRIKPNENLITIKIPDATPEVVAQYSLSDEQSLLAKVRYNRLIDIFLSLTTYSLQNHLRTTVKGLGQLEIDEIYVGINQNGDHAVIPVQAKGGKDQLSVVQTRQDMLCCEDKYPDLVCRPVSAQFINDNRIALFELTVENDQVKVVQEKHYLLVPGDQITSQDLRQYRSFP